MTMIDDRSEEAWLAYSYDECDVLCVVTSMCVISVVHLLYTYRHMRCIQMFEANNN